MRMHLLAFDGISIADKSRKGVACKATNLGHLQQAGGELSQKPGVDFLHAASYSQIGLRINNFQRLTPHSSLLTW